MLKVGIFVEDISYGGGLEIVSARLRDAFVRKAINAQIITLKEKTKRFIYSGEKTGLDCDVQDLIQNDTLKTVRNKLDKENFSHIIVQTSAPYSKFSCSILRLFKIKKGDVKIFMVFHTSPKNLVRRYWHKGETVAEFMLRCLKTLFFNIPKSYMFFLKSKGIVDKFITLSKGNHDELLEYFNVQSSIIPNYFEPIKYNLSESQKENLCVFVGRMDMEQKNIFYLIDAWKNVKDKKDWKFCIVGINENNKKLFNILKENNIDTLCYSDNKDVLDVLSRSSILLLASVYEGFPTVVLEACANANAVITTRYDGFSDEIVRDGQNGFVIRSRIFSRKFSDAIQNLISNKSLLRDMQEKSLDFYAEYMDTDVVSLWKKEFAQ